MTTEEYQRTQNELIAAGKMVERLDLNAFRDRIGTAISVGPVLDPTLYIQAHRNLQAIDELAAAAMRFKTAFAELKFQVASQLQETEYNP